MVLLFGTKSFGYNSYKIKAAKQESGYLLYIR